MDDIKWQIFNAFSFAVGDLMIGCNPVDSITDNIGTKNTLLHHFYRPPSPPLFIFYHHLLYFTYLLARISRLEKEIVTTFKLQNVLAWSVLGHIDISDAIASQAKNRNDNLIGLSFQSLAGKKKKRDPRKKEMNVVL